MKNFPSPQSTGKHKTALRSLANTGSYQVGVAKADITPSDWQQRTYWLAGFNADRPATSVNDPLYARAMVVDDGATPLAVVTLDLIGLTSPDVQRVQNAIAAKVPQLANRILVHATHTHEGPDTIGMWGGAGPVPFLNPRPLDYIDAIAAQAAKAVKGAWTNRKPATLKVANIDQKVLQDLVVDYRPPDVFDPMARLLVFSSGNQVVGTLVNWASHPEVLGEKDQAITADFVKWVVDEMESKLGGQTLFVNGAVGGLLTSESDKILPNLPRKSFRKAEAVGREVAKRLLRQLNNPGATDRVETLTNLSPIEYRSRTFYLPIENPLYISAKSLNRIPTPTFRQDQIPAPERKRAAGSATVYVQTEVNYIDFGSVSILTMGGELYPQLLVGGIDPSIGVAPYNKAPLEAPLVTHPDWATDPYKFFFGLTNDFLGYFVPQAEWDGWFNGFYGEQFSPAPDAGTILSENMRLLLAGYETGEYPTLASTSSVHGGIGNDMLNGSNGADILNGYQAADVLNGNDGNDILYGGSGPDTLRGGNGADKLHGKGERDVLLGNGGNDLLVGGLGADTLTGGMGNDRFVYQQLGDRQDTITDFNPAQDRIDLSLIFDHSAYTSTATFKDYIRLVQNGSSVTVKIDMDGGASGAFNSLVTLENMTVTRFGANQFVV
jgi:hypothetical protein